MLKYMDTAAERQKIWIDGIDHEMKKLEITTDCVRDQAKCIE